MLGIGVLWVFFLVYDLFFLVYDVVGRIFVIFLGVYIVFEVIIVRILDVVWNVMSRFVFVGIVIICNDDNKYWICNMNYLKEWFLNY